MSTKGGEEIKGGYMRVTYLMRFMAELKKLPFVERIIKAHYICDGSTILFRSEDGNAYEVIIRPARYARYHRDTVEKKRRKRG